MSALQPASGSVSRLLHELPRSLHRHEECVTRNASRGMRDLHLAILQRLARARGPVGVLVEREIAPPADGRIGKPFLALMQQPEIEQRIGVIGIGLERAREAGHSLVALALVAARYAASASTLRPVERSRLPRLNAAAGSLGSMRMTLR